MDSSGKGHFGRGNVVSLETHLNWSPYACGGMLSHAPFRRPNPQSLEMAILHSRDRETLE
jgi:hypothetical protein